jgi:hypothetical protein
LSIIVPALIVFITHLHPANSKNVLKCLGRFEVLFEDFDYFPNQDVLYSSSMDCPSMESSSSLVYWLPCIISKSVFHILGSNLCEVFLLGKALFAIKAQTESVASLLTPATLRKRRRYNYM